MIFKSFSVDSSSIQASPKNKGLYFNKLFFGVALGSFSITHLQAAETVAPAAPTWGLDPTMGTLLKPGISVTTLGTLVTPAGTDGDHALKLFDTSNITPTDLRPLENPDRHTHHHWDTGSIGNVFGLAIDNDRNIYATASTHYGAGYFQGPNNGAARIGFGEIGAGTSAETAVSDDDVKVLNDTAAAGTIYKLDSITGDATIFAQLPQTAVSFTQGVCEGGAVDIPRNTGPALGNIAYDPIHNQFFVSNFSDGQIYRLNSSGTQLSVFNPASVGDGIASVDKASPYGVAVNPDGTKLYFGTNEINSTPRLFAVSLNASGDFSGVEVNQNATLGTNLTYTQSIGQGYTSNPWVSYSDMKFSPNGELMLGLRTGCENNFATSHNHGGAYYLLVKDAGGLYNTPASQVPGDTDNGNTIGNYDAGSFPIHYRGDTNGPDDGYGGIAIYDKGMGEYDYLVTSADIAAEPGPHGFLLFPDDFTVTGDDANGGTFLMRPGASFAGLPSSGSTSGNNDDYKGVGGDIEVLSVLVDWGDAPDTYSTDLSTGNAAGGTDVRGPTHVLTSEGILLGATVDNEFNGAPSVDADGDDNASAPDDEDGISAFPELLPGDTSYTIPLANITGANNSGGNVTIHAWIDFDGNGKFDADEYTSTLLATGTGINPDSDLVWSGVSGVNGGKTYARFRVTSDDAGTANVIDATTPGGPASNGEVEDYVINVPHAMSIGSLVWVDTNEDGLQGTAIAEPRITGAKVNLLVNDGSGAFIQAKDLDGVDVAEFTTPASGQYLFSNLPEGEYKVTVDVPATYIASSTQNASGNADANGVDDTNIDTALTSGTIYTSGAVTLVAGDEPTEVGGFDGDDQDNSLIETNGNMTVDFGFVPLASIGDTVWYDTDRDGIQDAGETGVTGVTVTLFKDGVSTGQTDVTDGSGNYGFTGLEPGDYHVVFDLTTLPAGYVASPQDQGADNDVDSDANTTTGATVQTTLSPGENDLSWDMGISQPVTAIGDTVWYDTDRDGIQDAGETGVTGVTVTLFKDSVSTGQTDVTDGSGNYGFTDLEPGDYHVVFDLTTLPAGYVASPQDQGADNDVDSDANTTTGATVQTTLDPGENDTSWDMGINEPLVSIGNLVWIEDDNDGDSTTGTITSVTGVTVTATATDGTTYTDVTDGSGNYLINVPPNDTYIVTVGTPAGNVPAKGSTDSNVPNSAAENNLTHNGVGGTTVVLTTVDNLTLDFGYTPSVMIGSLIWIEDDGDGNATTGNITYPPAGTIVTATAIDGTMYTGITDGSGTYSIEVPINSEYTVSISPPAGYQPTTNIGGNEVPNNSSENNQSHSGSGTKVIIGTVDNTTVDFGFVPAAAPPPNSPNPIPTLSEWMLMMLAVLLLFAGKRESLRLSERKF